MDSKRKGAERAEDRSTAELRSEMIGLGPWHLDVEITPELSTKESLDALAGEHPPSFQEIGFVSPRDSFVDTFQKLYPNGLEGRSVLDCACNCGGFLFWAKELGAGECFGFDVREHWIEQARFLAKHRAGRGNDIRFEVQDLYDLPKLGLERFDITLFRGIFYHLPDPITGLKIAADLTSELLMVNTATRGRLPDGLLALSGESRSHVMSGVYGMSWFPTGPRVMCRILEWVGFPETRCNWWVRVPSQAPDSDRLELLASRASGFFGAFDATRGPRWREIVRTTVPPDHTMLIAHEVEPDVDEDQRMPVRFQGRRGLRFPLYQTGDAPKGAPSSSGAVISHLEQLRSEGIDYLVFPTASLDWLERSPEFAAHVHGRYRKVSHEDETCLVFNLSENS